MTVLVQVSHARVNCLQTITSWTTLSPALVMGKTKLQQFAWDGVGWKCSSRPVVLLSTGKRSHPVICWRREHVAVPSRPHGRIPDMLKNSCDYRNQSSSLDFGTGRYGSSRPPQRLRDGTRLPVVIMRRSSCFRRMKFPQIGACFYDDVSVDRS